MSSREVRVRVIEHRDTRWLAWLVALFGGLMVLAIITNTWRPPYEGHYAYRYLALGIPLALWPFGTTLSWRRRPSVKKASFDEKGAFMLDGQGFERSLVRGARAVKARRGYSIAVAVAGGRDMFLEVEREDDARWLIEHLNAEREPDERAWPGEGVPWETWSRGAAITQWAFGGIGAAFGAAYAIACGIFGSSDFKSTFGIPALIFAFIASFLFLIMPRLRKRTVIGKDVKEGAGEVTEHMKLHCMIEAERSLPDAVKPAVEESSTPARALLERNGDEPTIAWLQRIDAVTDAEGYRQNAIGQEELRAIAEDEASSTQARLAALRLLKRKHGGVPEELRVRVAEDLGDKRVRVATEAENLEQAAETLDDLGPAFDARIHLIGKSSPLR